jgi:hypothetical protein
MRRLRPHETVDTLFDVDYDRLYADGKRALIFDLDDTLGPHRMDRISPAVERLLCDLATRGFAIGVLTNRRFAGNDPVVRWLSSLYPTIHRAGKPRRAGFIALLRRLGAAPGDAVMIGDRRLTDVFGANRLGLYTIRVRRADFD